MTESLTTELRSFRPDDLDGLKQLIHHTIEVSYTEYYPPKVIDFFKQFHSEKDILQRTQIGHTLVALTEGKIVGTGSFVNNTILAVFVHPDTQKNGLGKKIMAELEAGVVTTGDGQIELDISLPSRQFYQGLGYIVNEEVIRDLGEGQKLKFWKATKGVSN